MHKVRIGIPIFMIMLLGGFGTLGMLELIELKNRKDYLEELRNRINNFAEEIKKTSFNSLKSKEKLFAKKGDEKKCLEKIAQKLNFKKVLIKHNISQNIEEVKVLAPQEQEIYKFLNELFFELPGIVHFKSIKISPAAGGDISAIIQFTTTAVEEHPHLIFFRKSEEKYNVIDFFKKVKTHKLFCVIAGSRAYIDNFWFGIGDNLGDGLLETIGSNFIEIQKEGGSRTRIKLGDKW
ncbi:MAG: hypothetical protein LBJ71_04135 [Holosporaceae bacterium]|jgi:hypothetical protein|nr:hypothetical protein [Holosporaceae bacterium]